MKRQGTVFRILVVLALAVVLAILFLPALPTDIGLWVMGAVVLLAVAGTVLFADVFFSGKVLSRERRGSVLAAVLSRTWMTLRAFYAASDRILGGRRPFAYHWGKAAGLISYMRTLICDVYAVHHLSNVALRRQRRGDAIGTGRRLDVVCPIRGQALAPV